MPRPKQRRPWRSKVHNLLRANSTNHLACAGSVETRRRRDGSGDQAVELLPQDVEARAERLHVASLQRVEPGAQLRDLVETRRR